MPVSAKWLLCRFKAFTVIEPSIKFTILTSQLLIEDSLVEAQWITKQMPEQRN